MSEPTTEEKKRADRGPGEPSDPPKVKTPEDPAKAAERRRDLRDKIWLAVVDKLVLGLMIVVFGFFANAKLEKVRRGETQRSAIANRRLEALTKVFSDLTEVEADWSEYGITMKKTVAENHPHLWNSQCITPTPDPKGPSPMCPIEAMRPAMDWRDKEAHKIVNTMLEELLIEPALREVVKKYRSMLKIAIQSEYNMVECGLKLPPPVPAAETLEFENWFAPCSRLLAPNARDLGDVKREIQKALDELTTRQMEE